MIAGIFSVLVFMKGMKFMKKIIIAFMILFSVALAFSSHLKYK